MNRKIRNKQIVKQLEERTKKEFRNRVSSGQPIHSTAPPNRVASAATVHAAEVASSQPTLSISEVTSTPSSDAAAEDDDDESEPEGLLLEALTAEKYTLGRGELSIVLPLPSFSMWLKIQKLEHAYRVASAFTHLQLQAAMGNAPENYKHNLLALLDLWRQTCCQIEHPRDMFYNLIYAYLYPHHLKTLKFWEVNTRKYAKNYPDYILTKPTPKKVKEWIDNLPFDEVDYQYLTTFLSKQIEKMQIRKKKQIHLV